MSASPPGAPGQAAPAERATQALAAVGFPQRWAGRSCVLLQPWFGDGSGVLAAWHRWRQLQSAAAPAGAGRPGAPPAAAPQHRLVLVSIAPRLPHPAALRACHAQAPWAALAARLADAWPVPTPDLHWLELEPRVHMLLGLGDTPWLRHLRLQAEVLLLDDAGCAGHAPRGTARQASPSQAARPPTDAALLKVLRRLAAPGAVLAVPPGQPVPPFRAPVAGPARRMPEAPARRHAIVIGAGIAGASCAAALARAGWTCQVLDAAPAAASGASGNPAALFHGIVHADDGPHARLTRACALHAQRVYAGLIAQGVPGCVDGLLRAGAAAPVGGDAADEDAAHALPGQVWPERWVQRLDGPALRARAPSLRADSAWFYPGGGWIDAAAAVRALLAAPGITLACGARAETLQRTAGGWQVLDAAGQLLGTADAVVLATAGVRPHLLHATGGAAAAVGTAGGAGARGAGRDAADPAAAGSAGTPMPSAAPTVPALPSGRRSRGQVTWFALPQARAALPHPVAGGGYAVAWTDGQVLCGATAQAGDEDPAMRAEDHRFNLDRLAASTGLQPAPGAALHGRVAWRHLTHDRLPLAGAVPAAVAGATPGAGASVQRLDSQPRVPGLYVLWGLGGRGFTWAPLLGELVAALVSGAPCPLDGRLADAVDPARLHLRQARRARGSAGHTQDAQAAVPATPAERAGSVPGA